MTTTKSYSNDSRFFSAYISALKTQFPFAIVSGIIFFILFIVVFFASTVNQFANPMASQFFRGYFQQGIYADVAQSVMALVILAFLVVASTLVGMSYLHRKNTVDLYHSLPVTRPQLMSANLLATLTAVLVPFVAVYLLTMAIQLITCARYGCFSAGYFLFIFFDIISAIVYTAVVAAFIAFIAVNVGTVFDAFSVALIMGFTPLGVYLISGMLWQSLVYGAYFNTDENFLYLSPFLFMFKRYVNFDRHPYALNYTDNAWLLFFGIVLTVIFFVLAAVCYRRRKSEIAEQTQPRGVLQIIVRLVAAFVGGAMFYAIFEGTGFVTRIIVMFIGAVGIGMIAELIFSRGVKSLGKNMKLLAGAGVVYCLLLILVRIDVFGYTMRIPDADSISAIKINYDGRFRDTDHHPEDYGEAECSTWLTSTESIAVVREAHSMAVNNNPLPWGSGNTQFDYSWLSIEYRLKNGSTMKRTYSPIYNQAYQKLAELEANDDFIRAESTLFWAEANPDLAKVDTVELYGAFDGASGQHTNVLDDPDAFLDAIRADMLEQSLENISNPKGPSLGFIVINFKPVERPDRYGYNAAKATVVVTREYRRTIEILKRLNLSGGFDDGSLSLDEVVRVGLASTDYYDSGHVRTFNYGANESEELPWSLWPKNSEDYYPRLSIFTDAERIRAVAQVSKDTLLIRSREDWNENYAIAYFEMKDGSCTRKAVWLDELPADILSEVRRSWAEADRLNGEEKLVSLENTDAIEVG